MQKAKSSRRDVLKTFGVGTVFSAAGGVGWTSLMLAEVRTQAAQVVNPLKLRVADFTALAKTNGSIRIGSSGVSGNSPIGLYYPIVITRGAGTTFYAVGSQCTHAGCVVPAANSKNGTISCPCHGSTYDRTGKVTGGPANSNLTAYATNYDSASGVLTVNVQFDPDQNLSIERYETLPGGAARLALEWTGFPGVNYEIHFRASVKAPSSVAAFSLTPDGPATETLLVGQGDIARVYVDRPAAGGFFQIAFNYSEV